MNLPKNTDSHTYKTNLRLPKGKGVERNKLGNWTNIYILLHIKCKNKDILYNSKGNPTQYLVVTYNGKNLEKNMYIYS